MRRWKSETDKSKAASLSSIVWHFCQQVAERQCGWYRKVVQKLEIDPVNEIIKAQKLFHQLSILIISHSCGGSWSQSQQTLEERWRMPWAGHWSITGQTQRQTTVHSHCHINEQLVGLICMYWDCRKKPMQEHGERASYRLMYSQWIFPLRVQSVIICRPFYFDATVTNTSYHYPVTCCALCCLHKVSR